MILRICFDLPIYSLLLVYCVTNAEIPDDWVDPHDMSPSVEYLAYTDGPLPLNDYYKDRNKGTANCECDASNKMSEAYLKRTINLLLNAVHEDYVTENLYSGHLFFQINTKNLEILQNFANGGNENVDLTKIDAILSQMLSKPTDKHVQEYLEGYFHKFLNLLLSKQGIIIVICLAYFYVIFKMFMAKFYWKYVLKFLICNFFIFDLAFTWVSLYKKAEIVKMADMARYKNLPMQCNPEKMDSWQYFWNIFATEDACRKYHEVNYQDIFWTVSPGLVVSEMFSNLVKGPLLTLGGAFSGTISQIYDAIPWPFNIIIFPVALVFLCIIIAILLTFVFTGSVKLNLFFHMLSFSVTGHAANNSAPASDNMITNPRFNELLQRIEQLPLRDTQSESQNKLSIENKPKRQLSSRNQALRLENLSNIKNEVVDSGENVTGAQQMAAPVVEPAKVTVDMKKHDNLNNSERICKEKENSAIKTESSQKEIVDDGKGDNIKASGTSDKQEAGNKPDLVSGGGDYS